MIPFNYDACTRQGGEEGPWAWDLLCRTVNDMLQKSWKDDENGIKLPLVGRVQILFWADNIYLSGNSWVTVSEMLFDLTSVLTKFGFIWKSDSLCLIGSSLRGKGTKSWASPLEKRSKFRLIVVWKRLAL